MSSSGSTVSNLITIANFTGQSKYSADFQTTLSRAVQLRSLNLLNMQQQQQTLQDQQTGLSALDSKFASLQNAVNNLQNSTGISSLQGALGNTSVGTVSIAAGATPANYTIEVLSDGSKAQAISDAGLPAVSDPSSQNISSSSAYTLTVGGVAHSLNLTNNSLQGLANAINGDSTLGVTASLVNVGSNGVANYRLTLQSSTLGDVSIQLNDGTSDLLGSLSQGSLAKYKLNGLSQEITSNSNIVTVAPGVTVNLQGTNVGAPTSLTVSQNTNGIQNALQNFANNYNAVVDQVNASHGQKANALQGSSYVVAAQSALRAIQGFTGNNNDDFSFLGMDLDLFGHLSFNASEFQASAANGISPILQYLGDSTTGFIQAAYKATDSMENPVSGFAKTGGQQLTQSLTNLGNQISDEVDKINEFQQNLLSQLSKSDAAIAQLDSQATLFAGLFNQKSDSNN